MANLIIPDKSTHEYVIGIDFGHAETSAAICKLEWDKSAGKRFYKAVDIEIDGHQIIPSAICIVNSEIHIGSEAFDHPTDNESVRISFKQPPQSLKGEEESLMCDFMRAVYNKIRNYDDRLTDTNHIVYIARPSGWNEENVKERYRLMALNAGIPLGGLTSESRAAIFYAKINGIFVKEISRGAMVFDLGSSTLDFTYLSDHDKPVDAGYNLGASIIDNVIYDKFILPIEEIQSFIDKYPVFKDRLIFEARKFKEYAYNRSSHRSILDFCLASILLNDTSDAINEFENVRVCRKIENTKELNDIIEDTTRYLTKIREALIDFKTNKIKDKKVYGVFMTGGATRMGFIKSLITETMGLPEDKVSRDGNDPSLTVSRGIALLGAVDALTYVAITELKEEINKFVKPIQLVKSLIEKLSQDISSSIFVEVYNTAMSWVEFGTGTKDDELKRWIKRDISKYRDGKMKIDIEASLRSFVKNESIRIQSKINDLIQNYDSTVKTLSMSDEYNVGDEVLIQKCLTLTSASMHELSNYINVSFDVIMKEVFKFLFLNVFYIFDKIYDIFRDDKTIRGNIVDKLLKDGNSITNNIRWRISFDLRRDQGFESTLKSSLIGYFNNLINYNLQKVIIPIE